MKIGIIGKSQSGKSTVFHALAPGGGTAHGMTHIAAVKVPDERLDWLSALFKPKKHTPATIDFMDFPALAIGKAEEEGPSGRQVLALMREMEALVVVLDGFSGTREALADLREIQSEMILADLAILENRIVKLKREIAKPSPRRDLDQAELAILERFVPELEKGNIPKEPVFLKAIVPYQPLTAKPVIPLINLKEDALAGFAPPAGFPTEGIAMCAKLEAEIGELPAADQTEYLAALGLKSLSLPLLVRRCYDVLGRIPFFTAGEDECRAWTIAKGDNAVTAAGKIHTDLARGFIRAEVYSFNDLKTLGSEKALKEKGKLRVEGKDYIVRDGDILNIRFSV
ncbi:MAG: DUF933 domain-containing protein [Planctomycetota bacterium]